MARTKRRITARGLLRLISDVGEFVLPLDKMAPYRWMRFDGRPIKDLDEYFPSVVERVGERLLREGYVEKKETVGGVVVKITEKGKRRVLLFKLEEMKPKGEKWDRMWRVVFFDISEVDKNKRDQLRKYLKKLGLKQMQESVWVSPYEVGDEVKYLREVLEVPHSVKLGLLKEVENEKELKEWFEL
ncbi:MAG: CRISPR-associated endonuclease Cas2 [Patescibacteria group bacterium]